MHTLFWHPSEFPEAAAKQGEVFQWDNACLHFLFVEETDISAFFHLGVVTVEPGFQVLQWEDPLKLINNEGLGFVSGTVPACHQNPREHSIYNISRKLAVLLGFFFCCFVGFFGFVFFPALPCIICLKRYRITLMHLLTRPTRSL